MHLIHVTLSPPSSPSSSPSSSAYLLLLLICILTESISGQTNRPPEFMPGGDMSNLLINENTPVGATVYTLRGRDPDGHRVFYFMSGDTFSVDKDTGVVTLIKPLDREREASLDIIVTIIDEKVNNKGANTISLQREVKVGDFNDNRPQFTGSPYSFTVSEATHPFTTVYEGLFVTDSDAGLNSQVTIECDANATPLACDVFHLKTVQVAEGKYKGSISLKGAPLDYESVSKYILRLVATDRGGLSSTIDVHIDVQDVQDEPPRFLNSPYSVTVNETTAPGTPVLTVLVRDGDATPLLRRPLRVQILKDVKRYFDLRHQSNDTWVIHSTQVAIDREDPEILLKGGIYEIGLRAVELINGRESGDVTFSNVTVVIHDINDQKPHFNLKAVNLVIPEDIANGSAIPGLNLVVSDTDIGTNARFSLHIQDLDHKNPASAALSVSPSIAIGRTPIIVKVINSNLLDFEDDVRRNFVFNIVAVQGHVQTTSRITLSLSDANDHQPVFESDQYYLQIPENVPSNVTVFTLEADDLDSGDLGRIEYSVKGFGSEKFVVNENTGEISIAFCERHLSNQPAAGPFPGDTDQEEEEEEVQCLDYEAQPSYSLTYEAKDGGGKHTSVNLFIEVLDINDNAPQFVKELYIREMYEKDKVISPPLFLRATDIDGPTQGGNHGIRYFVKETNLTGLSVDPVSGEVKLTEPVHADFTLNKITGLRKKLHYEAIVKAVDGGDPPQESEAMLIFHVKSERDGAPVFINEPYIVSVNENAPPGTIVTHVKATDPDGPDSALRYSLIEGAKDIFLVDEFTGDILVSSEAHLDRDLYGNKYSLTVAVVDAGFPVPLTSTTSVSVTVDDVNNKVPQFSSDSYVVYLPEKQLSPGDEIIRVSAVDPDSNSKLRYALSEAGIVARDKTGLLLSNGPQLFGNSFRIDPITGSIKVINKIDPSEVSAIVIPVEALDLNAYEPQMHAQKSTAELTIYIQTHNSKNPVFALPWDPRSPVYEITLPEETVVGSTLLTLAAQDPVTNKPILEFEKIKDTDPENYFSVSPMTGIVTLNKRIDFEELAMKQLKFSVKALAGNTVHFNVNNNNRLSSVANIVINIKDINDNSPTFSQDAYAVSVLESAQWPQTMLTVKATDKDSTEYGQVRYFVTGDGSQLFDVDPKSGTIGIKRNVTLDREARTTYNLQVTATDNNLEGPEERAVSGDKLNQKKTSVLVTIMLIDVNDNVPRFGKKFYEAIIPENVPLDFVVGHVHAEDPDEGLNGQISYEIVGLEDLPERNRLFNVNRTTGVLLVAKSLSGKGRQEPYEFHVKATDSGKRTLSAEVPFSITIGDISANDGIPKFIRPSLNEVITINENAKPASFVYQVEAVDADNPSSPNGKVMYKFLDPVPYFEMDSVSGIITTSSKKGKEYLLDREQRENFTLILVAFDLGSPSQESHRVLFIRVNDTDDNQPFFDRSPSTSSLAFQMNEESAVGSIVAKVKAIDRDVGNNARIVYDIINGNERDIFVIENDADGWGIIKSSKRLDRETDEKFLITIKARSAKKSNPQLSKYLPYDRHDLSQIQVEITIMDINDNPPVFSQSSYLIGVKVIADLHTSLLTFKAEDPDLSEKRTQIEYFIKDIKYFLGKEEKDNVTHVFHLNPETGLLRNEVSLRSYIGGHFNLTIEAKSDLTHSPASIEGMPNLSSLVNCKIYILREKDLMRFVFVKKPNEIRKMLKQLEKDVGDALRSSSSSASSPLSVNFDETQTFHERKDGSLDFESTSVCFQLINGNDLVLDHEEGFKYLRPQASDLMKEVYSNYSIIALEGCLDSKKSYQMSSAEGGLIIVGAFMAIISLLMACLASGMKRKLKRRMRTLGIVSGYNGPVLVPPMSSPQYGIPIVRSPSFVNMTDHQRIFEWQETTNPPLDTVSFRSFPTLR